MWKIATVVTHLCMGNATPCVLSNHASIKTWDSEVACLAAVENVRKRHQITAKLAGLTIDSVVSKCVPVDED